ncbi:MAG: adenylosuccinate synthetase [Caldilineaceae bacterium]
MSVTAIVGAQWGDEGKGRIIDYLAQQADVVIRFQGGDNAGHTVINEYGKHALHLIPSGIFNPNTQNIIGSGCVVNPQALLAEMADLEAAAVTLDNLWISNRAQMVMPYHRTLDALEEAARGKDTLLVPPSAHGTGLCRQGAALWVAARETCSSRIGWKDDSTMPCARSIARSKFWVANRLMARTLCPLHGLSGQTCRSDCGYHANLAPSVGHPERYLTRGAIGCDARSDRGIYPYVTSSNPTAALAALGLVFRRVQLTG